MKMGKLNKETTTELPKNDSWIPYPRKILSMFLNGELTHNEYFIYLHLRLSCNPYGVTSTSARQLNEDIFSNQITENWIYKSIRSLKRKNLIWYRERKGSRGSHEVHFGDFMLPNGKIRQLPPEKYNVEIKGLSALELTEESDVTPNETVSNQNLNLSNTKLVTGYNSSTSVAQIRPYNNDTDNEPNKDNKLSIAYKKEYKRKHSTSSFEPTTHEESVAWELAKNVGEPYMDFLLSLIKGGNYWVIEKAYIEIKELKDSFRQGISNLPAYVNARISKLMAKRIYEKTML